MKLDDFIGGVKSGRTPQFQETMAVIGENYRYTPTEFSNGLSEPLLNPAGKNEGSCKIFAFGLLHQLSEAQTLQLFGEYYRNDVLTHPEGEDHQNIRRFMRDGWDGVVFKGAALQAL